MSRVLYTHIATPWVLSIGMFIVGAGVVARAPVPATAIALCWIATRFAFNRWLVVQVEESEHGVVVRFLDGHTLALPGSVSVVTRRARLLRALMGGGPLIVEGDDRSGAGGRVLGVIHPSGMKTIQAG